MIIVLVWLFVIGIITIVAASIIGFFVNSINRSIGSMKGQDRCQRCKAKLTFANSSYATYCAKCGTQQTESDPFNKAIRQSKVELFDGEQATYVGRVKIGESTGILVLTNKRLHYSPRRGAERLQDWFLEDIQTVLSLADTKGFGIKTREVEKTIFRTPKKTEWYKKTLAAANNPTVKVIRSQKNPT